MVCDGSADWFKVLGSSFSHLGKIPLVLLGAVAYFNVFSLTTLGIRLRQRPLVLTHYRLVDVRSHWLVALRSGIYPSRVLSLLFVLRCHGLPPRLFSRRQPLALMPRRSACRHDIARFGVEIGEESRLPCDHRLA
jgi:hypothetical protein